MKFVPTILTLCTLLPTTTANANDFPTQARVEYVLRCMDSNGGQKYEVLYSCTCLIDKIADKIAYDDFVEAEVFAQLRRTAGERGGVFRDPDRASMLVRKIDELTEAGKKMCFTGINREMNDKKTERD